MELLYGTGNPAKLFYMAGRLRPLGIKLIGLKDLGTPVPKVDETGGTPLENARLKALAYYRAFHRPVFSCDSGLYLEGLPEDLQPGVHVRVVRGRRLDDEEMISYYGGLARQYGDLTARYHNAICFVRDAGRVYERMDESLDGRPFLLTCVPHAKRVAGFPLDSLSIDLESGRYFYDCPGSPDEETLPGDGFIRFFTQCLSADGD